jgi:methylated-DNA-protein-cysteine methyltransferase related protein
MSAPSTDQIYERIRRIPEGFVSTYGDISPGSPRNAGRALSEHPPDVPWWRVVHADGTWAKGDRQRERLLAEDVPIKGNRVIMAEALVPTDALD